MFPGVIHISHKKQHGRSPANRPRDKKTAAIVPCGWANDTSSRRRRNFHRHRRDRLPLRADGTPVGTDRTSVAADGPSVEADRTSVAADGPSVEASGTSVAADRTFVEGNGNSVAGNEGSQYLLMRPRISGGAGRISGRPLIRAWTDRSRSRDFQWKALPGRG